MKLSSFKLCLLISLLCHGVGFLVWQLWAPAATAQKMVSPVSAPLVIFSTGPVPEKIPAPSAVKPAALSLDKKLGKLFTAESYLPLKNLAGAPTAQTPVPEKRFAALTSGQTEAAKASPLAETATGHVIVGTRISRVFAVANIQPEYYKNPKPDYPASARREHQEGIVWLRVHITERGWPDRVVVTQSSGFEALDTAAVNAVRGWEFTPAQLGEVFVESEIDFPIQFRLD